MHIEELEGGVLVSEELQSSTGDASGNAIVLWDAKRALIGAGARALFYPTLLYNVVRNKIQSEFRWWDRVDEVKLLSLIFTLVSSFLIIEMLLFLLLSS